jgi:hypothetical protein
MFTQRHASERNEFAVKRRLQSRIIGLFVVFIPLCAVGFLLSPCKKQANSTPVASAPVLSVPATPIVTATPNPATPVVEDELPQVVKEETQPTL